MNSDLKKLIQCILVTAIISLSAHIFIMKGCHYLNNLINPDIPLPNPEYSRMIVFCAYLTSIVPTAFGVCIYYLIGNLAPSKNSFIKASIFAFFSLGIKGEIIRMPLMNFLCNLTYGWEKAAIWTFFNHAHVYLTSFIFWLTAVYLCPVLPIKISKEELS